MSTRITITKESGEVIDFTEAALAILADEDNWGYSWRDYADDKTVTSLYTLGHLLGVEGYQVKLADWKIHLEERAVERARREREAAIAREKRAERERERDAKREETMRHLENFAQAWLGGKR